MPFSINELKLFVVEDLVGGYRTLSTSSGQNQMALYLHLCNNCISVNGKQTNVYLVSVMLLQSDRSRTRMCYYDVLPCGNAVFVVHTIFI